MARKHILVALGATLALTLLSPPARGADDGLENPRSCGGVNGSGDVPEGTIVSLPPGSPPPSPTTAGPVVVDAGGRVLSNYYECINGHWVYVASALEVGPRVVADEVSVSVAEGSPATMTGTYGYDDVTPMTLDASSGVVTASADGTWSWTITGYAGDKQGTAGFDVVVSNVAPTVTSLVQSPAVALTGQPVTFTGIATDPSGADTTAGFTWSFDAPVIFDTCGSHTLDATATDKDSGVSEPATSSPVQVVDAGFGTPLTAGAHNVVRAGQVVPVRVTVGCDDTSTTGLSPAISLVRGDVDPATSSDDPSLLVPAANAPGETTGVMRDVGGAYLYNLRVPDGPSGSLFTIRVRPTAEAAPLSVLLQLR